MTKYRSPLKSLGQNFLINHGVIEKIIDAAELSEEDCVLEVGPGRGALTDILASRCKKLVLVEFDHKLASMLKERFAEQKHISVIDADILKVDLDSILSGGSNWKVVANLPYNISTEVLFRFLKHRHLFSKLILMLQKEVGERLVASPSTSDYGVTTLILGLWFDIRREFIVHPGCFNPPPKVDSAVLSFQTRTSPRYETGDENIYRKLVKAAFGMRRKTLNNCLKSANFLDEEKMSEILSKCEIEGRRRGETLSMTEYATLSREITDASNNNT